MRKLAEITNRKMICMRKENEKGFSLIETVVAIVILTVGVLAVLGAISFSWRLIQESEKATFSKEHARSTMETIFSVRDFQLFDETGTVPVYNWNSIQMKKAGTPGIFLEGWNPIRENPGTDGIYGTADDACPAPGNCTVGAYTNSSNVVPNYEQKIEITDINQNGLVNKRYIVISIRYMVGSQTRMVTESTILANFGDTVDD